MCRKEKKIIKTCKNLVKQQKEAKSDINVLNERKKLKRRRKTYCFFVTIV